MKKRQIGIALLKILINFQKHYDPDPVSGKPLLEKTKLQNKCYVTGGCIPSMLYNEPVSDYDVYFETENQAKWFEIWAANFIPKEDKIVTENAITIPKFKLQFIIKYYGAPSEMIETFDFKHLRSYWSLKSGLVLDPDIYSLLIEKELVYTGSVFPVASLLRTRKYLKKGWHIPGAEMMKIVFDIIAVFDLQGQTNAMSTVNLAGDSNEHKNMDYKTYKAIMDDLNHAKAKKVISCDFFLDQLLGIDPSTLQEQLKESTGADISLSDIVDRVNG